MDEFHEMLHELRIASKARMKEIDRFAIIMKEEMERTDSEMIHRALMRVAERFLK